MAYTPTEWACGDTITAEKLNKLENGLAECCGGGDVGYTCTESYTTLFDGSVTTELELEDPSATIPNWTPTSVPPTLRVTCNNVQYIVDRGDYYSDGEGNESGLYGAQWDDSLNEGNGGMDWSEYPFAINISISTDPDPQFTYAELITETAGTYSLKVESVSETIETTECFEKAVVSVVGNQSPLIVQKEYSMNSDTNEEMYTLQSDSAEIYEAFYSGRRVYVTSPDTHLYGQVVYAEMASSCSGTDYIFGVVGADSPVNNSGSFDVLCYKDVDGNGAQHIIAY